MDLEPVEIDFIADLTHLFCKNYSREDFSINLLYSYTQNVACLYPDE